MHYMNFRHRRIRFLKIKKAQKLTRSSRFLSADLLGKGVCEVEMAKSVLNYNLPNLIRFMVYQHAKER
jgi:hypothetical protein